MVIVAVGLMTGCAYTTKDLNEQSVLGINWVQTSAEYRALCYQSFNLSKMNLDAFLATYSGSKPVAIIVDADETVIDNSAYQAWLVGQDFGYSSQNLDSLDCGGRGQSDSWRSGVFKLRQGKGRRSFFTSPTAKLSGMKVPRRI